MTQETARMEKTDGASFHQKVISSILATWPRSVYGCVCVCVCEREMEGDREKEGGKRV